MNDLKPIIENYLNYCNFQKRLDPKTLKAYRIDLRQFSNFINITDVSAITPQIIENYLAQLHSKYKPKTVKRKIASIKALFHYLEYRDVIAANPFNKLQIKFREPVILPKTIPLRTIETLLSAIYSYQKNAPSNYQKKNALRDAAVIELLFATGIRISELCSLKINDVNLLDKTVLIYGKGSKERRVQIGNEDVINTLQKYKASFSSQIYNCNHFFVNQNGTPLSDQSVRRMINNMYL